MGKTFLFNTDLKENFLNFSTVPRYRADCQWPFSHFFFQRALTKRFQR